MTKYATMAAFATILMLSGCQFNGTYDFSNLLNEGERIIISKESANPKPDYGINVFRVSTSDGNKSLKQIMSQSVPVGQERTFLSQHSSSDGPELQWILMDRLNSGNISSAEGSTPSGEIIKVNASSDDGYLFTPGNGNDDEDNVWQEQLNGTKWKGNNDSHQLHLEFYTNNAGEVFLRTSGLPADFSDGMPSGEFTYGNESMAIFWELGGKVWLIEGTVLGTVNFDDQLVDVVIESPSRVIRAEDMRLHSNGYFEKTESKAYPEINRLDPNGTNLSGFLHGAGEGMSGSFGIRDGYKGVFVAERNNLTN